MASVVWRPSGAGWCRLPSPFTRVACLPTCLKELCGHIWTKSLSLLFPSLQLVKVKLPQARGVRLLATLPQGNRYIAPGRQHWMLLCLCMYRHGCMGCLGGWPSCMVAGWCLGDLPAWLLAGVWVEPHCMAAGWVTVSGLWNYRGV